MKRIFAGLLFAAAVCNGADFSGNWAGKAEVTANGEWSTKPLFLTLKQDGSRLNGTAGHSKVEPQRIRNGKVDGDTITFEVRSNEEADPPVIFHRLTLSGDRLVGTARGKNAETDMTATLELQREK